MKMIIESREQTVIAQTVPEPAALCQRCHQGALFADMITTAFWCDTGLVVVRNIPAMICSLCGEEYVSDAAVLGLDRMRGEGFRSAGATERMVVPVIDYVGLQPAEQDCGAE